MSSEADIDREMVLAAIRQLTHALGRDVADHWYGPSQRARALSSLLTEALTTGQAVREYLAGALATKAQPQQSLRVLPPLTLAERLHREHLQLRTDYDAACAAILDLQEEQGAYQGGRADGLRLATRVMRGAALPYTRQDLLNEWLGFGWHEAMALVMLDLIDHPERWQPEDPAPAQPDDLSVPAQIMTIPPGWQTGAPDPLGIPPNPTEADLDEAAVAALAAIYGGTGSPAHDALPRLAALFARLTANAHGAS